MEKRAGGKCGRAEAELDRNTRLSTNWDPNVSPSAISGESGTEFGIHLL